MSELKPYQWLVENWGIPRAKAYVLALEQETRLVKEPIFIDWDAFEAACEAYRKICPEGETPEQRAAWVKELTLELEALKKQLQEEEEGEEAKIFISKPWLITLGIIFGTNLFFALDTLINLVIRVFALGT